MQADLEAIRRTPGVVDAYATYSYPLSGSGSQVFVDREPLKEATMQSRARAAEYVVDEHAARTLGLRIVEGRWFTPDEVRDSGPPTDAPAIVITRSLARRLFPNGGAVGSIVYKRGDFPSTIVGVVDRLQTPWVNPGFGTSFVEQSILVPWHVGQARALFLVRTTPGAGSAVPDELHRRLRASDPRRVLPMTRWFEEQRRAIYRASRALASTLATVSLLLVLVTGLGIVGLTTYWSALRRPQIGVHRALGARRADILKRFQSENLAIAVAGLAVGSVLALSINLLLVKAVEMTRMSAGELLGAVAVLLVLAQLASLWPALRASSVPPALATRTG
jgi:putative ABC transport system permease protein